MKKHSSFDAVKDHMLTRGCDEAVDAGLQGDLEMIVRRAERVRSLGAEYGHVELSPYMQSLMRVTSAMGVNAEAEHTAVAASV
jgi:hypothetical protein